MQNVKYEGKDFTVSCDSVSTVQFCCRIYLYMGKDIEKTAYYHGDILLNKSNNSVFLL